MAEKNGRGTKTLARIRGAGISKHESEIMTPFGPVRSRPILIELEKGVHTYNVQGREAVNHDGYELLAGGAGVRIITPKVLLRYDCETKGIVEVGNPDIITDDGGRITAVWVRKIAAGFLPNGELSIVERTLYFSIESYFITTLQKKVSGKKEAARTVSLDEWNSLTKEQQRGFAFVLTAPELNAGMMVKLEHGEVQAALKARQEISQMAERRATTICERLVLDHHPAIAQGNLASGFGGSMKVDIPVINVRHQSAALERLFIDLSMGKEPQLKDVQITHTAEVITAESEVVPS